MPIPDISTFLRRQQVRSKALIGERIAFLKQTLFEWSISKFILWIIVASGIWLIFGLIVMIGLDGTLAVAIVLGLICAQYIRNDFLAKYR
jgi:hypothetical protein